MNDRDFRNGDDQYLGELDEPAESGRIPTATAHAGSTIRLFDTARILAAGVSHATRICSARTARPSGTLLSAGTPHAAGIPGFSRLQAGVLPLGRCVVHPGSCRVRLGELGTSYPGCTDPHFAIFLMCRKEFARWVLVGLASLAILYYTIWTVIYLINGSKSIVMLILALLLWTAPLVFVLLPPVGRALRGHRPHPPVPYGPMPYGSSYPGPYR